MIIIERILFLKQISIFSSLTSYELRKIAEVLTEEEFNAGETLFAEGDFGDCMYFVIDGKISVFTGKTPAIKVLCVFEKGDFFGEMGLYDDKPRAASGMAQTDACLLVLRKGEFCDLISEFPMVALGIMKELNQRIRETNKKLNLIEQNVIENNSKLYSREYFLECMKNLISKAGNDESTVGFLGIKLKKLLCQKGNPFSEDKNEEILSNLVKEIGSRLIKFVRDSDMICRFSDNFILVMISEMNHKGLLKFQARITDDLNKVLVDFEKKEKAYSDIDFKSFVFPKDADCFEDILELLEKI